MAEAKKAEGNAFFKAGKFPEAVAKYSEALALDDTMHTVFSNRAACYEKMKDFENSANDARSCIKCDKTFIKGYFRLATALKAENKLKEAEDALKMGLAVESRNKDLKQQLSEIQEMIRQEKVGAFIAKATDFNKSGSWAECLKACDSGLALDGGNDTLTALKKQVEPKFAKEEKTRVGKLSKTEKLKEEGDTYYKAANFELAIESYTKCLDALGDKSVELAIKCFSNRSACFKQLSNFDGTIEDCSMVLEADPENVKAILRRAQAFEAVERYKFAMQDVKTILSMPGDKVGAAIWKLANEMQHRLNRVIAQQKAMG